MDKEIIPLDVLDSEHTECRPRFRLVPKIIDDVDRERDGASDDGQDGEEPSHEAQEP